jgi:hypothetical protein
MAKAMRLVFQFTTEIGMAQFLMKVIKMRCVLSAYGMATSPR